MERALPMTTTLMLDELRDESRPEGWRRFSERYWPVLCGFGVKLGLNDADAADAAQWTLMQFLNEFRAGRYERARGRLSSFIIGIARNRILALRREARARQGRGGDVDLADELPDEATLTNIWENERRRMILDEAISQLRDSPRLAPGTFAAFELVALRGVPADEAARQASMTLNDVYVARSRCTRRLRELVGEITEAWDQDG